MPWLNDGMTTVMRGSSAMDDLAIPTQEALRLPFQRERFAHVLQAASGQRFAQRAVGEQALHGGGERGGVVRRDEHAALAMADLLGDAADRGCDDGRAAGARLEQHVAERLDVRGVEVDVGGAVEVGELGAVARERREAELDAADLLARRLFADGEDDDGARPGARAEALDRAAQRGVVLPDILADAVRRDEQNERVRLDAERRPRGGAIAGEERARIDAVRDHAAVDRAGGDDRLHDAVHHPLRRRRHVQPARREDGALALPVERRGVALHGGKKREVGTVAAAAFPALASEREGAVAAHQPAVADVEDRRDAAAQLRQKTEVEVAAVQVVEVDDVRPLRRQVEQAPGAGEVDVLAPTGRLEQTRWLGEKAGARGGGADARDGAPAVDRADDGVARVIVRDDDDVRIGGVLPADGEPRVVAAAAILVEQILCRALGAAGRVARRNPQDPHGVPPNARTPSTKTREAHVRSGGRRRSRSMAVVSTRY